MSGKLKKMSLLRNHAVADDMNSVRSAIRQYIEMLEDLYKNVQVSL